MKIIKEELQFEESLKQRLEFICEFSKVTLTFINESIRKIENTNLSYIQPYRAVIKNTTFLVFNYFNDVYISNVKTTRGLDDQSQTNHLCYEVYSKVDFIGRKIWQKNQHTLSIQEQIEIKQQLQKFKGFWHKTIKYFQDKWSGIKFNTKENYEKFDNILKSIDEEYRTTNINMAKYFNIMFAETKLMESPVEHQNQVALYLFNNINLENK